MSASPWSTHAGGLGPYASSHAVDRAEFAAVGYDARMMVRTACLALFTCSTLAACGDAGTDDTGDTGDGTTGATGGPGDTGESADTGTPGTTEPADSDDQPTSTTSPTGADTTATDSGDDTTGDPTGDETTDTGEPSPWDGEPLPDGADGEWQWIDFPDAKCRNGSETGIGVRYGSGDGLVIYFEGGGACFNTLTCGANPDAYNEGNFAGFAGGGGTQNFFSTDAENPVGDWSFIYVPYCTGDVHAGDRPDAMLPDVLGTQQFVGYANVALYLDRIVPTFLADTTHVLVSGQSAGGFGAAFNYDRIADAFPAARVTLLDDSGPPMSDEYMTPCLQKQWREAWGLDDTMPADCTDCFPADGGGIVNLGTYLGEKHSDQHLVLVSSLADETIRFFFGFGANDCNVIFPSTPADVFEAGLYDLRDNHLNTPEGVWGSYFIEGSQHTWIGSGSYFTEEVDGVKLVDWIAALIDGQTSNVSP